MAGQSTPQSHKVLRDAVGDLRKVLCYQLGRQAGIIDRWLLPPPRDAGSRDANGIPNPLDHVIAICQIAASDSPERARRMMDWLCRQCGGRFVAPPAGQHELMMDIDRAVTLLGELDREQKRKKPRPERLTDIRRGLQNFIDLLGEE